MMISQKIKGDLLIAFEVKKVDAIVHGCNCFCLMGAGIAKAISSNFPGAFFTDLATNKGDKSKLGSYTIYDHWPGGQIINAYTQYKPGKCETNLLYENIRIIFSKLNCDYANKTIGIPKIGAGIAGGNWEIIENIINDCTPNLNIHLYYLD